MSTVQRSELLQWGCGSTGISLLPYVISQCTIVDNLKNNEILFSGRNFWMDNMCAQGHCHVEETGSVPTEVLLVSCSLFLVDTTDQSGRILESHLTSKNS